MLLKNCWSGGIRCEFIHEYTSFALYHIGKIQRAPLHHQKRVSESIRLTLNKDSRITIQCLEEYDMPAIFTKNSFSNGGRCCVAVFSLDLLSGGFEARTMTRSRPGIMTNPLLVEHSWHPQSRAFPSRWQCLSG